MNVVDEIYKMISTDYIKVVLDERLRFLQLDAMMVDVSSSFQPQRFMAELYKKYVHRFAAISYKNLSAIALAPFRLVSVQVDIGTGKRIVKMPVALNPGSFTVQVDMDDKENKIITVELKSKKNKTKIYVVESQHRSGLDYYNPTIVDSDCGHMLQRWKEFNELKQDTMDIRRILKRPQIWIEKHHDKINKSNDEQQARADNILSYKRDEHGYKRKGTVEIEVVKKQNLMILPPGYGLCSTQPTHLAQLLDIENEKSDFKSFVDEALGMPMKSSKTGISPFATRTRSAVEEAKANKMAMLAELIADITHVLKEALKLCIEEDIQIPVSIPMRSVLDSESIYKLHEFGVIDDDVAREELLKIFGLDQSKGGAGVMKRDNPNQPPDEIKDDEKDDEDN